MRLWEPSISRPEHVSVLPRILAKALAGALEKRSAPGALVVTPRAQQPKVPYLNGKKWEFAVSVAMDPGSSTFDPWPAATYQTERSFILEGSMVSPRLNCAVSVTVLLLLTVTLTLSAIFNKKL